MERAQQLIEWIMSTRVLRAWNRYSSVKGPAFAQGMTLSAFLSLFAALFIAFGLFTQFLAGNDELQHTIVQSLANSVPGLIDTGSGGIITPDALLNARIAGITGLIASGGILFTAISWIATSRDGFRAVFGLPDVARNPVLLKLTDLLVALCLGLLVLVSAALLLGTQTFVREWLGLRGWGTAIALVAQFILDASFVVLMARYGAYLRLRWRSSLLMGVACAVAFAILKQLATLLFAGVDRNPLYASIATVVIVLLWLGFIMQTMLIVTAWVAVGARGEAYQEQALIDEKEREERPEREAKAAAERAERAEELETRREELARIRHTQKQLSRRRRR